MSEHHHSAQLSRPLEAPEERVFEGVEQETVEILPNIEHMSPAMREQGVEARVGRDRIERRVSEGTPPSLSNPWTAERQRSDEIMQATYRLAGYYAIAIAGLILAAAIAIVVTNSVGILNAR